MNSLLNFSDEKHQYYWSSKISSPFIENIVFRIIENIPTSRSDLGALVALKTLWSAQSILTSLVRCFVVQFQKKDKPTFDKFQFTSLIKEFKVVWQKLLKARTAENGEQAFAKYHIDVILCNAFNDKTLPIKSETLPPFTLFSGWIKKYIHRRIVVKRDVSFAYSLQKGTKKCWSTLGPHSMYKTLKQHSEDLSKKGSPINDELSNEITLNMRRINKPRGSLLGTKFLPSGSACLQRKMADGGVLSLTKRLEVDSSGLKDLYHNVENWRKENFSLFADKFIKNLNSRINYQIKFKGHDFLKGFDKVDTGGAKEPVWATAYSNNSVVAIIPEASKYRIVTKGDGYLAGLLQPLQGILIDNWKNTKFSTMRDDDLTKKVNHLRKGLIAHGLSNQFPLLQSGDYKRATDLLNSETTKVAIDALEGLVADSYLQLAKFSIVGGFVHYPSVKKFARSWGLNESDFPDLPSIAVESGQLMGHSLSFPLLCVINLSCYTLALKDYYSMYPNRLSKEQFLFLKKNVLINGDDILFYTNEDFNRLWEIRTKQAGFQPSVGKNYQSEDVCMINSQVFQLKNHDGEITFQKQGYFSQKFFVNGSENPFEFLGGLSKMFRQCPKSQVCLPEAIKQWKLTDKISFRPNWFFPRHLGGFGIYTEQTFEEIFKNSTPEQRQVAAMFISDPRLSLIFIGDEAHTWSSLPSMFDNIEMIPVGPHTGEKIENKFSIEDQLNEWKLRFTESQRMAYPNPMEAPIQIKTFRKIFKKNLKKVALKPISFDTFCEYQWVDFYMSALPECPSHQELRFTSSQKKKIYNYVPMFFGSFPVELDRNNETNVKKLMKDLRIIKETTITKIRSKAPRWSSTFDAGESTYVSVGDVAWEL